MHEVPGPGRSKGLNLNRAASILLSLIARYPGSRAPGRRASGRRFQAAILFAAGLCLFAPPARAAKTDVVVLQNGDRITGEIRKLDDGKLEYKTDNIATIYVEWEKIVHIRSIHRFELVDTEGIRRFGSLESTDVPGELVVVTSAALDTVDVLSIVRMYPIREGFFKRLRGSISAGFSYTRATETAELTLGGDTTYRGETMAGKLIYDGYFTDQAENRTSRFETGFGVDRFMRKRWTVGGVAWLQHNEELGLDLRESLAATGGRYLVETNKTVLRLGLGLAGTRETYVDTDSTAYNVELPVQISYSRFTFHNPKSSITASGSLLPSLTTEGRYRASLTADIDHEVLTNFYIVIGFYYDYDSAPPAGSAKDDYRINTSFRWTFG